MSLLRFPTLQALQGQLAPEALRTLTLDFERYERLVSEHDNRRQAFQVQLERCRLEREVLQTALVGLFNLFSDAQPEDFFRQGLELVTRLAGAEIGALYFAHLPLEPMPGSQDASRLFVRHCTDADEAFIREELELPRGVLRQALELGRLVRLPREGDPAALLENLRQRHVKAAIALPLGEPGRRAPGLLYLEHLSRADAFSGDLPLVMESLKLLRGMALRQARGTEQQFRTDHTVPYRREGRYRSLVGRSEGMAGVLAQLELLRLGRSRSAIHLVGERGSGRERVARAIHEQSDRADRPFVAVDCPAEGEGRLELALFGDDREGPDGLRSVGALERARGGTLLLREVHWLPIAAQHRLLRALVERRYWRREGGMPLSLDVRLLSSSTGGLEAAVSAGDFSPELAERLCLLELRLPPLRERRADIVPLAEHFLAQVSEASGRRLWFSAQALAELERRPLPGNSLELRELVAAAAANCSSGILEPAQLREAEYGGLPGELGNGPLKSWKVEHEEFQRRLIRAAMEQGGRNVTRAAKLLGISRQYLNNRLRALEMVDLRGLDADAGDGEDEEG